MEQGASVLERKRSCRTGRRNERGFTLVEILVVITIIGLIMALVGPRVLNYLSESKVKAAKIQIQSFSSALDLFYLDTGRYPSRAEGLGALVQPAGGAASWNGPYLKGGNVPLDPWGKAICVSLAGPTWRLRCCLPRLGRAGGRRRNGRRYHELVAVTVSSRKAGSRCSRSFASSLLSRFSRQFCFREYRPERRDRGLRPMRLRRPRCSPWIAARRYVGTCKFLPKSMRRYVRFVQGRPVVSSAYRMTWFSMRYCRSSAMETRRFRPLAFCRPECPAAARSC